MKPRIFSDWNYELDVEFDLPVDLYIDNGSQNFDENSTSLKILLLWEPPHLFPELYFHALVEGHKYDYILTYYDKVLEKSPNAIFFRYDNCWINKNYVPKDKKFGISTVVGYKRYTQGHLVRHDLWEQKHKITNPNYFYLSQHGGHPRMTADDVLSLFRNNLILGENKDPLFDYQFHIVIENVKMKNMFSEKLTDTCRALSIPIYWGCTNIEEYYDTRGMIVCDTLKDVIDNCNDVNENTYNKMLPFVIKNGEKSFQYSNGKTDLIKIIRALVNKRIAK